MHFERKIKYISKTKWDISILLNFATFYENPVCALEMKRLLSERQNGKRIKLET
jgi:hypothetical protein